jgi:hypothetical protein
MSKLCPLDERAEAGTTCRAAAGTCDAAEACDGTSDQCPDDALLDERTTCRASLGACDPEEQCTGSDLECPSDVRTEAGQSCDDGLFCNGKDTCDESGQCVHAGDPCAQGRDESDASCSQACDEAAQACTGPETGTLCRLRTCAPSQCEQGQCVVSEGCPLFVDPAGNDGPGCGEAWGSAACATPQGGVDEAVRIGASVVLVRSATFRPRTPGDPVLRMAQGVAMYGGFAGTETALAERTPTFAHTVLRGEHVNADGAITRSAHVVLGASNARLDGFEVTLGEGPFGAGMLNESLDDLTITASRFTHNSGLSAEGTASGAGMLNRQVTRLHLQDVVFEANELQSATRALGAGMASYESELTLERVQFRANRVAGQASGGGMWDGDRTISALSAVTFIENVATGSTATGAGYALEGGASATIVDARFLGNLIDGAEHGAGAGLYLADGDAEIEGTAFANNAGTANLVGAGIFVRDGALILRDSDLRDNESRALATASGGAGLHAEQANVTLTDCRLTGNVSRAERGNAEGGAMHVRDGELRLQRVDILDNQARAKTRGQGGALFLTGEVRATALDLLLANNEVFGADAEGGGLYGALWGTGSLRVLHASIVNNELHPNGVAAGGGVHLPSARSGGDASMEILNSIVAGNLPNDFAAEPGPARYRHLCGTTDPGPAVSEGFTAFVYAPDVEMVPYASGEWVLGDGFRHVASTCWGRADVAVATEAYGSNGWMALAVSDSLITDTRAPSPGRHYVRDDFFAIAYLRHEDADTLSLEPYGPSDATCTLRGGSTERTFGFTAESYISTPFEHREPEGTEFELVCSRGARVVRAETRPLNDGAPGGGPGSEREETTLSRSFKPAPVAKALRERRDDAQYAPYQNAGFAGMTLAALGDVLFVGLAKADTRLVDGGGRELCLREVDADCEPETGAVQVWSRRDDAWQLLQVLTAADAQPGDLFGHALAADGSRIVIGAPGEDSPQGTVGDDCSADEEQACAEQSGAAYVFEKLGGGFRQVSRLKPVTDSPEGLFGYAVALSGPTLVVGAPKERADSTGAQADPFAAPGGVEGAVHVFRDRDGDWVHEAFIQEPFRASTWVNWGWGVAFMTWSWFGSALAVEGDTLVVGAPGHNSGIGGIDGDNLVHGCAGYSQPTGEGGCSMDSGIVYVLRRGPEGYRYVTWVKPETPASGSFGLALAIEDGRIAVGEPLGLCGDDAPRGAVQLLEPLDGGYVYGSRVCAPPSPPKLPTQPGAEEPQVYEHEGFGSTVALRDGRLAVGFPLGDGFEPNASCDTDRTCTPASGAVYVYARDQAGALHATQTIRPDRQGELGFGSAVLWMGEDLLISAPLDDCPEGDARCVADSGSLWWWP